MAVAVAVMIAVPVVPGDVSIGAMPPSDPLSGLLTVAVPYEAAHVHVEGQSESTVQLVTMAWQLPGKEVVVVHTGVVGVPASNAGEGGGTGDSPEPPPPPVPDDAVPVPPELPAEPEPEQLPIVLGWHTKPSPQSVSALHGSCHL